MSGIYDQVRIFLNNIQNDSNVQANLLDLKVALISLNSNQRSEVSRQCQLGSLFDCLNSSNQEQIITTCEVLKIILPSLHVSELITKNESALIRALGHPVPEVKVVILEELIRAVGNEKLMLAIEKENKLLLSVAECLCHPDVAVGKRAVDFFIKLGQTKCGLVSLCQPIVIKEIIGNIGDNNVYALRIFEVLVELSTEDGDALKYLENEGLLDRISSFLRTDDILAMLALVELCTKMAITSHGWDFLSRHGVMKHLVEQFVTYDDNPLSSLTFPGLSKFFGQIGQNTPGVLVETYPEVLRCAFNAVDSSDMNVFIPALELIGTIAYSPEGKRVLQKQDERLMRHVMGRLYEAMTKLPTEWRVRALQTVANIVRIDRNSIQSNTNQDCHSRIRLNQVPNDTSDVMRLTETWFNQLGMHGLSTIQEIAQQPFPELKSAAFLIILNLACQKWGQNKIYEANNLLEFLLNRRIESDAEALQMKYNILKTFIELPVSDSIFEVGEYEAIVEYVRQGPFYSPSTTAVAVEGAD